MLRIIAAALARSAALLLLALAIPARAAFAEPQLIFAAASLKPALDEALASAPAKRLGEIKASYAASSQLARQIEAGAPATIFVSADRDWMDELASRRLIVDGSRSDWLGNALVLVAPAGRAPTLALDPPVDLARVLGADGRLAIAEPNSVPAGKYAKAALVALGAWDGVADRLVAADNVRAALNFVVRGEAPLGIVYRTDARSEPGVATVATFPAASHAPIVYPIAIVAGHDSPEARAVLSWLRSPDATRVFERAGFDVIPMPAR